MKREMQGPPLTDKSNMSSIYIRQTARCCLGNMIFSSYKKMRHKWSSNSLTVIWKYIWNLQWYHYISVFETQLLSPWLEEWANSAVSSSFIGHEQSKFITVVVKDVSKHQLQRKLLTTALVARCNKYMWFPEFIFNSMWTCLGGSSPKDCPFSFTDWHMGPTKWPEHDGQSEGEDNQCVRFIV